MTFGKEEDMMSHQGQIQHILCCLVKWEGDPS
jgi:hypothetical protein